MSDAGAFKPQSASQSWTSRGADVATTILSLGTNKLLARGSTWLKRHGLVKYVVPAILLNEAAGAYRAYLAGGAMGFW